MSGNIANYFARMGIDVDQSSLKRVDALLKSIEKRLSRFATNSEKLTLNPNQAINNLVKQSGKNLEATAQSASKVIDQATKTAKTTSDKIVEDTKKAQSNLRYATKAQINASQKAFREAATTRLSYLNPSDSNQTSARQKMYEGLFGTKQATASEIKATQAKFFADAKQRLSYLSPTEQSVNSQQARQAMYDQMFGAFSKRTYKSLSERTINSNRSSFFSNARKSDVRTGQGLQYRLGEQQQQNLLAYQIASIKMFERQINSAKALEQQRIKMQQRAIADEKRKKKTEEREAERQIKIERKEAARQSREEEKRRVERDRYERRQERLRDLAGRRNGRYGGLSGLAAFGRFGVMGLPFAGGALASVMAFNSLNRANQQMLSNQLSSNAVLGERSQEAQDWLKNQANRIGFNYGEVMPQFTGFMASAMPSMGYENSRDIFKAFTQFGMTRGATQQSMGRGLYAVQQMAAKGFVLTEELQSQLAEAQGFGELPALFAQAYQEFTGGDLTGQESMAAFIKAREKKLAKSSDLLPIVARLMNEKSAGSLSAFSESSMAAQNRFSNSTLKLLEVFSKSGGERGFTKFWKDLQESIDSTTPLVRGFSGVFEKMMITLQIPHEIFQSINDGFGLISKSIGISEDNLLSLAGVGLLLTTRLGTLGLIITGVAIAIEDVVAALRGYDSISGRLVKSIAKDEATNPEFVTGKNTQVVGLPNTQVGEQRDIYLESIRQEERDRYKRLHGDSAVSNVLGEMSARFSGMSAGFGNMYSSEEDFAAMNEQRKKMGLSTIQVPQKTTNEYNFGSVTINIPESQVPQGTDARSFGELAAQWWHKTVQETMNSMPVP